MKDRPAWKNYLWVFIKFQDQRPNKATIVTKVCSMRNYSILSFL